MGSDRRERLVWPLVTFLGAVGGALLARLLEVPGGLVVGGTLGATVTVLLLDRPVHLTPSAVRTIQILVGITVGTRITPDTITTLSATLVPALIATFVLVAAGVGMAHLLYRFGSAPEWILLATSPGGLEAVVAVAVERDANPVEVALFHLIRILLVILSVPVLLWLMG